MEIPHVIRSISGILENIPFDRPEPRGRFIIETNELNGIPYHIRRYFDVCFIYRDDVEFDACCILQKTVSIYTIVIIIRRAFETDFQAQEANNVFLFFYYRSVCRRRELYCHEVCHLVAIIRAFPSYKDESTQENFFWGIFSAYNIRARVESLERIFYQKTLRSFRYVLTGLKTMLVYNIPLSFSDFEESPSEFDRAHFPYKGDELNYFKLFSEFMVSDKKLKKHIEKILAG
jgi:hypothetical protein